jgi:hypothetical protein
MHVSANNLHWPGMLYVHPVDACPTSMPLLLSRAAGPSGMLTSVLASIHSLVSVVVPATYLLGLTACVACIRQGTVLISVVTATAKLIPAHSCVRLLDVNAMHHNTPSCTSVDTHPQATHS